MQWQCGTISVLSLIVYRRLQICWRSAMSPERVLLQTYSSEFACSSCLPASFYPCLPSSLPFFTILSCILYSPPRNAVMKDSPVFVKSAEESASDLFSTKCQVIQYTAALSSMHLDWLTSTPLSRYYDLIFNLHLHFIFCDGIGRSCSHSGCDKLRLKHRK